MKILHINLLSLGIIGIALLPSACSKTGISGGNLTSEIDVRVIDKNFANQKLNNWLERKGYEPVEISWKELTQHTPKNPMEETTEPKVFIKRDFGSESYTAWGIAQPTEKRPFIGVYHIAFTHESWGRFEELREKADAEASEFWNYIENVIRKTGSNNTDLLKNK